MQSSTPYRYYAALDGVRGVAILLVMVSHAGLQHIVPGMLGVLIFFVLSGFLLTGQMTQEIKTTGTLSLTHFYLRRFFRLVPALVVYLAVFAVILISLGAAIAPIHIASGLFYFANYWQIFVGYPPANPVPILWSLSVEEHYYLLFPFCMLLFRKRLPMLLPWLTLAMMGAVVWRAVLYAHCASDPYWMLCGLSPHDRLHGTDTIFDCILFGAATALLCDMYAEKVRRVLVNPAALGFASLGLLLSLLYRDPAFREVLRFSVQAACTVVLIVNAVWDEGGILKRVLSVAPLVWVGRLSYSLYLFHYGMLNVFYAMNIRGNYFEQPVVVVAYFVSSFTLAALSYFLVERPMIAMRRRFGSHRLPSATTHDRAC